MHLTDGRELKFIDRGGAYAYRWQAVYGVTSRFMPIANLRGVAWRGRCASACHDRARPRDQWGLDFHVFSRDNASIERYAAWLTVSGRPSGGSRRPTTSATTA